MENYLKIVSNVLANGVVKSNRTGIDTIAIPGAEFRHDMQDGFPLLTTKAMPFKVMAAELEFFIKGFTDKAWLQERGCHIWDQWCNPKIIPYGHGKYTRVMMESERDLGPIYGWQWRHFGAQYSGHTGDIKYTAGIDQLKNLVNGIKTNPADRQMIVNAWNPMDLDKMALPPCHWGFQVTVIGDKLNLFWNQRSVDVALGLPFNIASYGLLLYLLAWKTGYRPGHLVGFLGDVHIYKNHIPGLVEQCKRSPYILPNLEVCDSFDSIFDWEYTMINRSNYFCHAPIKFEIAV